MKRAWSCEAVGRLAVLGAAMTLAPSLAKADWIKAETDRFVVYGEGREASVRNYAIKLTTFDMVLRTFNPVAANRRPGHKVEVYLVRSPGVLRQIVRNAPDHLRGFYTATSDGVFAAVTEGGDSMSGEDVLFHEYAHHFMLENFPAAYPSWFVEGWAEYFMPTEIMPKTVKVGAYNLNRVYWLFNSPWLPMDQLLSKRLGEVRKGERVVYYPQAWLFMHYMRSDPARAAQLDAAIQAIAAGKEPVEAFSDATGQNMEQLERALRKYTKLPAYSFPNPLQAPPEMKVTALPRSANDFLIPGLRLAAAGPGEKDDAFLEDVRRRAARYPGDRLAELTLARAEFTFGDVAAGEAILKRRLEADPQDGEALRLSGLAQIFAGLREPSTRLERFRAARPPLGKAYGIDKNDYRILYAYAFSRTAEPNFPTENDMKALTEARAMAPSVQEVSFVTGSALLKRDRKAEALAVLAPIANNPHGGRLAVQARALMAGKTMQEADAEAQRIERDGDDDAAPPEPPSTPPAKPLKSDEAAPVSP